MILAAGMLESAARLFTVILIFLFVLLLTYGTTRYIARFQKQQIDTTNIEILETSRIAPNKYLQIVRAGEKYILLAVCKDTVTMLSELDPGTLKPKQETSQMDFKQILEKARKYAADSKNDKKRADKNE